MKSNEAPKKVRSLISGGMLLLAGIITLSACQSGGESRENASPKSTALPTVGGNKVREVPRHKVPGIMTWSDNLEAQDTNLIGQSLTAHTVVSFQQFMDNFKHITDSLTVIIDLKSEATQDSTLAEKNLSWQIGLYPMLEIDSLRHKKRINIYVIPTLAHYINDSTVNDIRNYRVRSVRSATYKNVEVPVYDLGNNFP